CCYFNMACERPPAGRFAPRLSPFVRGTVSNPRSRLYFGSVPLTKGDSRGAKRPARGSLTHHVSTCLLRADTAGALNELEELAAMAVPVRANAFFGDR